MTDNPTGIRSKGVIGMEHKFRNCNRDCRHWTLDGVPVEVERREETAPILYRNRIPVTATAEIWRGEHMLDDGFHTYKVVRSETYDAGPLGLTLTYNIQPEYTEAEKREHRRNLKRVIEQVFPGYTLADA